jgi:hypothetical protein
MNQFKKKVKQKNLFKEYTKILNGLLELSDREKQLFYLLLEIDLKWRPVLGEHKTLLSTDNRRAIMDETRINKNNLSKYISELVERGILILNERKGYEINKTLIPIIKDDKIEVSFIIELEEIEK